MKDYTQIIKRPIVTEKGTMLRQEENQVVFAVAKHANKIEIKKAVEELFSVHVEDVKTMNMNGKTKRFGMHTYRRPDWKKAIVTLRSGESIEFYEGV
ncbi:MAG: 50S ribosomal protein L23 [Pseudomonadota bacterium]|jgi:large subunit ribosomal protein L23|uniref:50S ribosomal subunit protein L23 n=1 Tax=anaerobic digester metagenome TaxID=1263854 RepID=A0A485LXE6_9ZZZZ|nr:50S ribosomal protein L23 [Pseudomonadota bacterium]HPD22318.1 50S ribosomal protein L23 [Deltaproteobacteria bacterium]HPX19329.1 50S ribosomal protein L23 [Deltaproteobacteria bacterium]HRS57241.1 50S ribosomal protein L23 [Desulfomonilia bacterium]HRV36702.1 50S ribosomal protein L23 [Desulfomonilia bacterium]